MYALIAVLIIVSPYSHDATIASLTSNRLPTAMKTNKEKVNSKIGRKIRNICFSLSIKIWSLKPIKNIRELIDTIRPRRDNPVICSAAIKNTRNKSKIWIGACKDRKKGWLAFSKKPPARIAYSETTTYKAKADEGTKRIKIDLNSNPDTRNATTDAHDLAFVFFGTKK